MFLKICQTTNFSSKTFFKPKEFPKITLQPLTLIQTHLLILNLLYKDYKNT